MIMSLSLSRGKKDKGPAINMSAPPIADLIPPRSRAARELRELRRRWTFIVSVVGFLVVLSVAGGFAFKLTAKHGLDNEIQNQAKLTAEIATYKDVNEAVSGIADLEAKRNSAMQSEILWAGTVKKIEDALPSDVRLDSFTGAAGGNPYDDASPSVAFVTVVKSERPIAYSEVLSIFSNIENLSDVEIGDLSSEKIKPAEGGPEVRTYKYSVAFGVDATAYSKRFVIETPPAAAPSAETPETPEAGSN